MDAHDRNSALEARSAESIKLLGRGAKGGPFDNNDDSGYISSSSSSDDDKDPRPRRPPYGTKVMVGKLDGPIHRTLSKSPSRDKLEARGEEIIEPLKHAHNGESDSDSGSDTDDYSRSPRIVGRMEQLSKPGGEAMQSDSSDSENKREQASVKNKKEDEKKEIKAKHEHEERLRKMDEAYQSISQ
ncbi:hypothetical protein PspLS_06920 [Pyricularia sp. CBS 133598]|nr:hypothetical protein PspLS_06920 [Pyricularia sp. CBS 133598]